MKRTIRNQWKVALAAGVVASLGLLPQARAELVYEPEVSPNAPVQVREQDREATRQALESSVKAQDTVQAIQAQNAAVQPVTQVVAQPVAQPVTQYVTQQPVQPTRYVAQQPVQYVQQQPQYVTQQPVQYVQAPVQQAPAAVVAQSQPVAVPVAVQVQPQVQVAPETATADAQSQPEVQSLSKAELMRRERTRTELQNEDLLEERLEELRLRDEKRRTDELLGEAPSTQEQVAPIQGLALSGAQPQSQVVVSPVTDRPGQPAPEIAPVPVSQQYSANGSPYTPSAQGQIDQINTGQAAAMSTANASAISSDENKPAGFYISPRAGISSLNVNSSLSGVSASGLYSVGIALGVAVSDNVGFEVGYTNAQYGINLGQMYEIPGLTPYSYQLSQNVIDAMLKLYFLGPDSRLRPYVGAGGGYAMSSLNYPNQVTSYEPMLNNQSYNSNAFLGELEAGMDVKISKSVSVGAMFKYSDVLSSNQNNNNLYYYGGGYGYSGYPGAYGGVGENAQQQLTGASLSQASFYSVLADLNFSF